MIKLFISLIIFLKIFILNFSITFAEELNNRESSLYYAVSECTNSSKICNDAHKELLLLLENKEDKYSNPYYATVKYWAADSLYNSNLLSDKKLAVKIWIEILNDNHFDKESDEVIYTYIALGWHHYLDIEDLDDEKAFLYMSKAAETNNMWAINNLGVFYEQGRVIKKDLKKAFKLYSNAASQGLDYSYGNIANFHILGRAGTDKSFEKTIRNHKLARIVEFGDDDFGDLGLLLKYQRLPKNLKEYLNWLESDLIEKQYPELFMNLAWTEEYADDKKNQASKKTLIKQHKWFYLCKKFSNIKRDKVRCAQELNILENFYLTKNEIKISIDNSNDWIKKNWR